MCVESEWVYVCVCVGDCVGWWVGRYVYLCMGWMGGYMYVYVCGGCVGWWVCVCLFVYGWVGMCVYVCVGLVDGCIYVYVCLGCVGWG